MVTIFSDYAACKIVHVVDKESERERVWSLYFLLTLFEKLLWRKKERARECGWSGPTQWSLATLWFSPHPPSPFCTVDIVWSWKIHGNKGNLWLETSWIWNWCCQLRAAQTPEWRKVGRGMQRGSRAPISVSHHSFQQRLRTSSKEQKPLKSIQKGAQIPESRKVRQGMQRKSSDIGLSKQFPIYISANGRRLENMVTITLPELEIGPWYQEKVSNWGQVIMFLRQ